MPTENRSSNTEMVSVPRDWANHYADLLEERCAYEQSERVKAFLAKPAEHQGEPVALPARKHIAGPPQPYTQRGHDIGWNACLDEIAKLGPLYRRPVQGEPVAWFTDDHLSDKSATTWDNETAERWRAKGWPVSPLYAHADPGEVERLNTVIERQKNLIASLRAELVESYSIDASAEPSAPVERDERAEYDAWRHSESGYVRPFNRHEWSAWQARAALDRKP